MVPLTLDDDPWKGPGSGLARVNARAATWCTEVNAVVHSEICAVPAQRLKSERGLLGPLPGLRLEVGPKPVARKVDKLSCIRFASARYSVPNRLIGATVTLTVADGRIRAVRSAGAAGSDTAEPAPADSASAPDADAPRIDASGMIVVPT